MSRARVLLAALALVLGCAACAGGYDGPPEPFVAGERSHGHP